VIWRCCTATVEYNWLGFQGTSERPPRLQSSKRTEGRVVLEQDGLGSLGIFGNFCDLGLINSTQTNANSQEGNPNQVPAQSAGFQAFSGLDIMQKNT